MHIPKVVKQYGGVFVLGFFFAFGFLASWLLGFSASWLLGFWASGLFAGFCLFASSAFPVPFAAFRWFMRLLAAFGGFGFSHPSGFLAFAPFH